MEKKPLSLGNWGACLGKGGASGARRVHAASEQGDHNDLIVEMSLRYPWLDLKGVK
jgi:hypothetical protein